MLKRIKVDKDNVFEVSKMSKTLSDKQQHFVATNAFSLAQAYVIPKAEPWVAIVDDAIVGFAMMHYGTSDDQPDKDEAFLWRLMVSGEHQGKGYGKAIMNQLFEEAKLKGYSVFTTSCGMGEGSPYEFYLKLGFIDTGIVDDDENILEYALENLTI